MVCLDLANRQIIKLTHGVVSIAFTLPQVAHASAVSSFRSTNIVDHQRSAKLMAVPMMSFKRDEAEDGNRG